ncbi:hypothetical protein [Dyadobacter arcticus]|uniref:Uncharacterized protein n=1 Tax=Dyadobacter arcticus TaxID=1078754 RepID=A0ABX0UQX9_9BACT|nr:hypothetical protein [Dyadobacter arcticus]NIJ55372.1 hypothetical protein [Dyadobacter arcticus]
MNTTQNSLNAIVEDYLFADGLENVTFSMRKHIVNQLRVATLVARLENSYKNIVKL